MLEKILDCEKTLFIQLNGVHSPFCDQFMWLFSSIVCWIPPLSAFIIILYYTNRQQWKETLLIVVAFVLVITLCDQFASSLCKPYFSRFRPTHHPDFKNVVITVFDYRGGPYGFISSHAANGFGFATLTSLIFRNKYYTISLFLWATVNAYSRIYLGVHFISDIIPGVAVGFFFGWIVYLFYKNVHKKRAVKNADGNLLSKEIGLRHDIVVTIFLYLLVLTVFIMVIISLLYSFRIIPAIKL